MPNDNGTKSATLAGERTCIKVTKETRAKLAKRGNKGDTYEVVINILLGSDCNKIMEEEKPTP